MDLVQRAELAEILQPLTDGDLVYLASEISLDIIRDHIDRYDQETQKRMMVQLSDQYLKEWRGKLK